METVLAIRSLGVNTETWDPIINYILLGKLHKDTITHYECQRENVEEIKSLKDFLTYIEGRCLAIQAAESKAYSNFGCNSNTNSKSNEKKKIDFKEKSMRIG